ncbi:autophagy protein [Mycoemilia scoparia]|uniref:Autophagy protein n=1 Tax=Mycoemilia scoparia TaxID=417184 RepID=A0A9W8DNZ7_9FUNG|nr:autophagy protein [Mycoemilia scoparia]
MMLSDSKLAQKLTMDENQRFLNEKPIIVRDPNTLKTSKDSDGLDSTRNQKIKEGIVGGLKNHGALGENANENLKINESFIMLSSSQIPESITIGNNNTGPKKGLIDLKASSKAAATTVVERLYQLSPTKRKQAAGNLLDRTKDGQHHHQHHHEFADRQSIGGSSKENNSTSSSSGGGGGGSPGPDGDRLNSKSSARSNFSTNVGGNDPTKQSGGVIGKGGGHDYFIESGPESTTNGRGGDGSSGGGRSGTSSNNNNNNNNNDTGTSNSQYGGKAFGINQQFRVISRLMDILEERSELNHPLCVNCTERLLKLLETEAAKKEKEMSMYEDYLYTLQAEPSPTEEECERLEAVLKQQQQHESSLDESLQALDRQLEEAQRELEVLLEEYNQFDSKMENFRDEQEAVERQHELNTLQLGFLQKVNVYNDVFNISSDGSIGTINGFRLGRLPNQLVEWSEINAAWGQALLLLIAVAHKLKYEFKSYRLIPVGSYSRIERITEDGEAATAGGHELYGSGELHIGRIFHNRRFDQAMVAYLNCLNQLAKAVERIDQDRVGGVSIKLQFSNEETWTRALYYTLLNAKWILAFASSFVHPDDASSQ